MKQDIKNKDLRGRHEYVPASVTVITTYEQQVICLSPSEVASPWGGTTEEEI